MIYYDDENKQILTPLCRQCPDNYFSPAHAALPHVGCCSYSPTFTLFELYKMVKEDQQDFFLENIYNHPANTIAPYEITIHAQVHPLFTANDYSDLSALEYEDKKLGYSICQFFIPNKGCSLPPLFKTSICRSFICSTIEESLAEDQKKELAIWSANITKEARDFNHKHQQRLEREGWNLHNHVSFILDYFKSYKDWGERDDNGIK